MRTPDRWDHARATVTIAIVTFAAWLAIDLFGFGLWAAQQGAFVPAYWSTGIHFPVSLLTPLTTTLIHFSLLDVGLTLVMLLICGRAVEGAVGPANLAFLYVVGAYAAATAQFAVSPAGVEPMIGASGAVSAVIGAYAMLFGKNKVRIAHPGLAFWLNSAWLLAAWVGLQVIIGVVSMRPAILVVAAGHIGGFLVGLILARPLLLYRYRNA